MFVDRYRGLSKSITMKNSNIDEKQQKQIKIILL